MEEQNSKDFIEILNKGKVLEFNLNKKSGYDESEIYIKNISQKNILSKIYINNPKYFKFNPNIFILPKNSQKKIKVIMDNKDYIVSNKDIFLIISNIIDNDLDEKNLDEFFKKNKCKENGQKVFLYGYKKLEEKKNINNNNNDKELIKKIKELEQEIFMDKEMKIDEIINKVEEKKHSYINYLILFALLVFIINLCLTKFLKK